MEQATLAGGCFWCTEAIYQRLKGVSLVEPGYSGGQVENPSYEQVSSSQTGHAEAIQITFDPNQINFEKILDVFFKTHDPTTLNKQGNDVGNQYRSVIFYHSPQQKELAERSKQEHQKGFTDPIVTEIVPFVTFYKAENYHQNYYNTHQDQAYCKIVIDPKIEKLQKEFKSDLKS